MNKKIRSEIIFKESKRIGDLHKPYLIAEIGVKIFNIGQNLQPSKKNLEVSRFVHPDQFKVYKEFGYDLGFKVVESAPLVRSSYHADEQVKLYNN